MPQMYVHLYYVDPVLCVGRRATSCLCARPSWRPYVWTRPRTCSTPAATQRQKRYIYIRISYCY